MKKYRLSISGENNGGNFYRLVLPLKSYLKFTEREIIKLKNQKPEDGELMFNTKEDEL